MRAKDLTVIIPSRNEEFLPQTINSVLQNSEADTEVVVILDGEEQIHLSRRQVRLWQESRRVWWFRQKEPIGQRGATNLGAKSSEAKFIMKLDAHSAVDKGFDVKLMADCEKDWTVIPRMYKLHVFDWVCEQCGERYYQANKEEKCLKCNGIEFKTDVVWRPKIEFPIDFARFDNTLHFQYWLRYHHRRNEAQKDIADVMSSIGACWFMERERFLELDGLDEGHGFWGQVGTEMACKSWLSGGRQVVNKKTWFAHFFRVGRLKFPYPISGQAQERARVYSRDMWFNNKWPKQKYPLKWLVDKFSPVPTWENFNWSEVHNG